jgi:hypothetical protein
MQQTVMATNIVLDTTINPGVVQRNHMPIRTSATMGNKNTLAHLPISCRTDSVVRWKVVNDVSPA